MAIIAAAIVEVAVDPALVGALVAIGIAPSLETGAAVVASERTAKEIRRLEGGLEVLTPMRSTLVGVV